MSFTEVELEYLPRWHPVAVFHAFWLEAADGKSVAPWARFDAIDHPKILPWMILLKREACSVCAGGYHFRYTVCGTGCTDLFGVSYQGKLFGADMPPESVARRQAEFDRVMAGSGPLFSETHIPFPNRDFVRIYWGVFPFSTDGRTVDRIMVVLADVARKVASHGHGVHVVAAPSMPPGRSEAPDDNGNGPAEYQ